MDARAPGQIERGLNQQSGDSDDRKTTAAQSPLTKRLRNSSPAPVAVAVLSLSPREQEVLKLVAEGLSNVEVAEQLILSPETVKTYLRNIRTKLGVRNRAAAVNIAVRRGLIK
ncbi:response regulator transcription factor [Frankia sp. CNm7]|uniref:Response regulator transcription factor n=1 Tax=Frankia nepalensis TaxID=1836974 RepID=A0A937UNK1_9ACTN|nr:response regulator transcription factor [Frankia nepalensis]MBL7501636.1 response regulator transcription factor [Frankia nepalensis]MBL7513380.1 response regulator transcription factor [Frankia nepalensis]MBL7523023.1 response regulator transcription factor [Frankia nepalensis]MBL7628067.1 response regulator transcription factor [Frankia nepalensis]